MIHLAGTRGQVDCKNDSYAKNLCRCNYTEKYFPNDSGRNLTPTILYEDEDDPTYVHTIAKILSNTKSLAHLLIEKSKLHPRQVLPFIERDFSQTTRGFNFKCMKRERDLSFFLSFGGRVTTN